MRLLLNPDKAALVRLKLLGAPLDAARLKLDGEPLECAFSITFEKVGIEPVRLESRGRSRAGRTVEL